jgi:glutamate carboxypeptidase
MARFALFLETAADASTGTTVTPTLASAGSATNVVPESARLTADVRVWTASEAGRVRSVLAGYSPRDAGVAVEIAARFDRPAMEETASPRLLRGTARSRPRSGKIFRRNGSAALGRQPHRVGRRADADGPGPSGPRARGGRMGRRRDFVPAALLERFLRDHP